MFLVSTICQVMECITGGICRLWYNDCQSLPQRLCLPAWLQYPVARTADQPMCSHNSRMNHYYQTPVSKRYKSIRNRYKKERVIIERKKNEVKLTLILTMASYLVNYISCVFITSNISSRSKTHFSQIYQTDRQIKYTWLPKIS